MITKVFKTEHLNSVIDYVYREDKDPLVVGSTCLDSERVGALSELRSSIKTRPEIKQPVFHAVLSAHLNDRINNDQWEQIADQYMDQMGFKGCAYVAVKHHDTDHEHIHIVASRIRPDRTLVTDKFDHYRTQVVARGIEQAHDLERLECGWERDQKQPTQRQWHQLKRTGQLSQKARMQQLIQARLSEKQGWTMSAFRQNLAKDRVNMVPRLTKDGSKIVGVYFESEGVRIPGSKINRRYGWNRLQEQVSYDRQRDFASLTRPPEADRPTSKPRTQPTKSTSRPTQHSTLRPTQVKPDPVLVSKPKPVDHRSHIHRALQNAQWDQGYAAWSKSLQRYGVEVVPKVTQKELTKVVGVYFEHQGERFAGSKVDRSYSWGNVQKRLGPYEAQRDFAAFDAVEIPGIGRASRQSIENTLAQSKPKTVTKPATKPAQQTQILQVANLEKPVKDNPYLAHFVKQGQPIEAKQRGQWLSLDEAIALQKQQGNQWQHTGHGVDKRYTLLPRDLMVKEGRYHVLVDQKHNVLVMPYDRRLEQVRAQDVVIGFEQSQTPVLKGRAQVSVPAPTPMRVELDQFASKQTSVIEARQANQQYMDASAFVQNQSKPGQSWSVGIEHTKHPHQRVMETDVLVKQGRMHVLVDQKKQHVTLVAFDERLAKHRGKFVDVSALKRAQKPQQPEQDNRMTLAQWKARVAQKDTRRIDIIAEGQKHRGKLLDREMPLKEGRFLVIEKANVDIVLVPYDKRFEALKGKDVIVTKTGNEVKMEGVEKSLDRGRDR